jgi:hypothetical protein
MEAKTFHTNALSFPLFALLTEFCRVNESAKITPQVKMFSQARLSSSTIYMTTAGRLRQVY